MAQPDGNGPVPPRAVPEAIDGAVLRRWLALAAAAASRATLSRVPVTGREMAAQVVEAMRS